MLSSKQRADALAIAKTFRKLGYFKVSGPTKETGPISGKTIYFVELEYQAAGHSDKEYYVIEVRSTGLGGVFVWGNHSGMVGEIRALANEARRK